MPPPGDPYPHELRLGIWTLVYAPTIWALHFLACYVGAAWLCARAGSPWADLAGYRVFVALATAAALAAILLVGWHGGRLYGFGLPEPPYDRDSEEDRRRLLATSVTLLSGLSFVATLFTALPAAWVLDCR